MASISVMDMKHWLLKVGSTLVDYCLFWLCLSLAISYFIECIISYQLQTPESPAEKKLGGQSLTVVNWTVLEKTPTNTHHMLPCKGRLISWFKLNGLRFQHDMNDMEGKYIWMIR